ncbi:MAG: class I SAM-dependent methyltransferase [Woeseiaceae bacterium]
MPTISKYLVAVCIFLAITEPGQAGNGDDIAEALASPARTDADRERDGRDKPQQVLEFAGFGKGMLIADVFGGGGYYSEILSVLVGDEGKILLVNNAPYDAYVKKELTPRLADNRLPNVEYLLVPNDAMGLGGDRLDGALIIMSYHDLFYADPEDGWPAIDGEQFIDQIVTALKPGGRLLIVDHAARAGTGSDDTQSLHRIDEDFAVAELSARGLRWVGSTPDLRNADDDRSLSAFDPAIRGQTDRFVHVYEKPEN